MKNNHNDKTSSLLTITVEGESLKFVSNKPCIIDVNITNTSGRGLLINKRLSVGFEKSVSRELFLEIRERKSGKPVSRSAIRYDRPPPSKNDYGKLLPGESVSTKFDICEWYKIQLPQGDHDLDLIVFYQADELVDEPVPENVVSGVFQSDPVDIKWTQVH